MFAQRRAPVRRPALQVMIRCLGVYPPGSVVRLSNDAPRPGLVGQPATALRWWVTVRPPVPRDEAIMLDLDEEPDIQHHQGPAPHPPAARGVRYLSRASG